MEKRKKNSEAGGERELEENRDREIKREIESDIQKQRETIFTE